MTDYRIEISFASIRPWERQHETGINQRTAPVDRSVAPALGRMVPDRKIDKAMINMIAKFMATVEPQAPSRPVCSDDDGLLIDAVIRHYLKNVDEERMSDFCLLRL
jgi:hypothetical protein